MLASRALGVPIRKEPPLHQCTQVTGVFLSEYLICTNSFHPVTALAGGHCCHLHFTNEVTEAQRDSAAGSQPRSGRGGQSSASRVLGFFVVDTPRKTKRALGPEKARRPVPGCAGNSPLSGSWGLLRQSLVSRDCCGENTRSSHRN